MRVPSFRDRRSSSITGRSPQLPGLAAGRFTDIMAALSWFRSTLADDAPPAGLNPPLQALWFAGKTEFAAEELFEVFDRIGGNGTAADGTVYPAGTSPPPEVRYFLLSRVCFRAFFVTVCVFSQVAGPPGSAPWLWTTGHAICQVDP